MRGDLISILDEHENAASAIAKKVLEEREKKPKNYKYIVGISGESGSGKTEISYALGLQLKKQHIRVKIIQTDNYFTIPPLLKTEWRRAKGIESVGINEYDWPLINRNIQDFKEDRESMMPCIDLIPEQVDKLISDFKKIDMLIISGLYAIKADGIDLRVLIEMKNPELVAAQKAPEQNEKTEFAISVMEKEHQNVTALKPLCDLVINKGYQVVNSKNNVPV
jgi:uridine kinase